MLGLGGYIKGLRPRETESTDARLLITRKPGEEASRRHGHAHEEAPAEEEDLARVSLEALLSFFESLLLSEASPGAAQTQTQDQAAEDFAMLSPVPQPAGTPYAARAAEAYRQTAHNHDLRYGAREHDQAASPQEDFSMRSSLSEEDFRTLWELHGLARALQSKGVAFVTIARGPSFLQSLRSALEQAAAP